jgi:hypothetical protein
MLTRDEFLNSRVADLHAFHMHVFHGEHRGGGRYVVFSLHTLSRYDRLTLREVLGRFKAARARRPRPVS